VVSDPRFTRGLPRSLTLAIGQSVRVPLEGAMGAGNTWQALAVGDTIEATVEVIPPAGHDKPAGGLPPGTSAASEVLIVTGVRPGTATVSLRLGRSWEPETPLATHQLDVRVSER
jgi:Chagasin family peptidase inhibitor I42